MKPKYSQTQLAFHQLLQATDWLAPHDFMGEILVNGEFYFGTYSAPKRLSDLFLENPGLLEREMFTGQSGAKYFRYKIKEPRDLFDDIASRVEDKGLLEMINL